MAEHFFGITDTGKQRDNNEDTFIAEPAGDRFVIACVIDGVGGYEGGEVAAAIARETIREALKGSPSDLIAAMRQALIDANDRIFAEKQKVKEYDSMACVLTAAVTDIENNVFYYAHIGDTRLYLFRDSSLVKVTRDHSFVGFLEDSGRLSEESAMRHPKRNEINKALGFKPQLEPNKDYIETGESPFLPGDLLLLCSDGLTDLVNRQEIASILSKTAPLEKKGAELITAANNKGGKDNITVVLVQNDKQRFQQKATKPVRPKNAPRRVVPAVKKEEPVPSEIKKVQRKVVPAQKAPAEKVVAQKAPTQKAPAQKSNHNMLVVVLSVLCGVLLLIIIFLLLRGGNDADPKEVTSDTTEQSSNYLRTDSLIMVDTTKTIDSLH